MEKNMLNEIARMRKMMGLNENYDNYFDTSDIDNWQKGGGSDEEEIFDAHFEERTYNGKERTFLVDEFEKEHSIFKIVNTPEAEKELEMYNLNDKRNTGSSVTGVFNVDVDGVQTKVLTYPDRFDKPEMYENLNEFVDSVKIIDDGFRAMEPIIKGLSVSANARNDVWRENPEKAREFVEAFNKLVTNFVESTQQYDDNGYGRKIPTEPEEKKKYVINQIDQQLYGFIFNRGSGSFVRAYMDPYKTQVVTALEKLTKELGLTYSNGRLKNFLNRPKED